MTQFTEKVKAAKDITVGIISPYKEQVQYLTQLIAADEVVTKCSNKNCS
jgi:superfamily I DNA and/or RNA helicase